MLTTQPNKETRCKKIYLIELWEFAARFFICLYCEHLQHLQDVFLICRCFFYLQCVFLSYSVLSSLGHRSIYLCLSINVSIHLFICPSIHPSQLVLTNFALLVKVGWISNAFVFYFLTFKLNCQYVCKSEHTYFSQWGWRFFSQGFPHCWRLCSCRCRHQWEWRTGEWGTHLGSGTAEGGIQGTATSWL